MMISRLFSVTSEGRKLAILTFLCYAVLCSLMLTCMVELGGCQIDVGANLGTKMFYPDKAGDSNVGDPRKGMYEGETGSHTEQHSVTTTVEHKPFPGISKGGE